MTGVVSTGRSFLAARPPSAGAVVRPSGGPEATMFPRLMVLTDRSQLRLGRGLVRTITECVNVGLTHVVVREHDLPAEARSALVAALVAVPGLTVISSRIPDAAAQGLHLPATSTSTTPPPRYSQEGWRLIGRSCHNQDEVRRAAHEGADYVTLSPFATTPSKPGYGPTLPKSAYVGHDVPVYALGGITVDNASAARVAGAHGVAVMGAVMRAADPADVVARLLEAAA